MYWLHYFIQLQEPCEEGVVLVPILQIKITQRRDWRAKSCAPKVEFVWLQTPYSLELPLFPSVSEARNWSVDKLQAPIYLALADILGLTDKSWLKFLVPVAEPFHWDPVFLTGPCYSGSSFTVLCKGQNRALRSQLLMFPKGYWLRYHYYHQI